MQIQPHAIIKFSSIATVVAAVVAIIGIFQTFSINPLELKQIARPASTFINKNFAANYLELILPVAITLFLISKNKSEAWAAAFIVSMIASYLFLTKTRGTYIALLVTLAFLLLSIRIFPRLNKQVIQTGSLYKKQVLFILLIPFVLASLPNKMFTPDYEANRFKSLFQSNFESSNRSKDQIVWKRQNSITSRLNAYENSLDLLKENPIFGVGLGGFQSNFRPYMQSALAKNKIFSDYTYLHNEPLQLFIELGIIGGMAVVLFLIFLLRRSFYSLKHIPDHDISINREKVLYLGFFIAATASLSHSFFSFPYHQPVSATIFAIWIGFILNLSAKNIFFSNVIKQQIAKRLLLTASFIFLIGIILFYSKYIESSYYMKQSTTATDCNSASKLAILSIETYGKDYLTQSQGINIVASCPADTKIKLLFAENILKNNPTHPWALYLAGISHFTLGNYESSYKLLKSLSFLYPYYSNTYIFIGHIAAKQKNYREAKSYYQYALKFSPANKAAQNMLKQLSKKGY